MSNPRATAPGRTPRRVRALVATLLATGLWASTGDGSAAAADCDGVTVRVERSASAVVERCASGAPGDGLAVLQAAGFSYGFVPGQAGFVCTIDGYPDPCNDAPSDAYWSYWHADPGADSWAYSARGGASRTPPPGGADAWVFGDGSRPPSTPPPTAASSSDDGPDDQDTPAPAAPRTPPRPTGDEADDPPTDSSASVDGDAAAGTARDDTTTEHGEDRPAEDPTAESERSTTDGTADEAAGDDPDDARELGSGASRPDARPETAGTRDEDASADDTARTGTADGDARAAADPVSAGADTVVVGDGRAGGRSAAGAAIAGVVVAGIAGAGVVRSRRRDGADADTGPGL